MAKKNETNADFAVIKTGGKQYLVTVGEEILVDRLHPVESPRSGVPNGQFNRVKNKKNKVSIKGDKIEFETLLKKDKAGLKIGNPALKTKVLGEVIEEIKDEKIVIFKYKPKKRYRKKTGFRAKKTKIKILGI